MKPWIALSGDDDGKFYVLVPTSEDPNVWDYDVQLILDTGDTTAGTMAVADLDGDGYTDIVAAGYSQGRIHVFTYAP